MKLTTNNAQHTFSWNYVWAVLMEMMMAMMLTLNTLTVTEVLIFRVKRHESEIVI